MRIAPHSFRRRRAFPDAFTVRCFAFEPSDEQTQEDRKGQRNFIMFPPGGRGWFRFGCTNTQNLCTWKPWLPLVLLLVLLLLRQGRPADSLRLPSIVATFLLPRAGDHEQLDNHAEVVMHDFAACLLGELERWMLNASPAMVDLNTLVGDVFFFVFA